MIYFKLVKTFFKETFGIQRMFGLRIQQSRIKSTLMVGLIIYAFSVIGFSTGLLHYELALILEPIGQMPQLILSALSYLTGVGFILSFFQAQGTLFQYKDFDLLGPMPIRSKIITSAKVTILLIFIYMFSSMFVIPIVIVYSLFSPLLLWQWLALFIMFSLAPIPMIAFGSLVALLIRKLAQKKLRPQLLQTIFSVVFFFVFISFTYAQNYIIEQGLITEEILRFILNIYLPSRWFFNVLITEDLLSFIFYILFHGLFFYFFIILLTKLTIKTNQTRTTLLFVGKEKIPTKIKPMLQTLIKKEWSRFINTPVYFLNTGFGLIILIIGSIAMIVFPQEFITGLEEVLSTGVSVEWLVFIVFGFTIAMVYTPAISLSLEGKNFAFLKTLPLATKTLLMGKIMFNLTIIIPIYSFSLIITSIILGINFFHTVLLWFLLLSLAVFLSFIYLGINILFPRFDFQTETEVVKQSIASLIAIFFGIGTIIIFSVLGLQVFANFPIIINLLIVLLIATGMAGMSAFIIVRFGIKAASKLEP
jgi:ABC-2 type transport system permease protein